MWPHLLRSRGTGLSSSSKPYTLMLDTRENNKKGSIAGQQQQTTTTKAFVAHVSVYPCHQWCPDLRILTANLI